MASSLENHLNIGLKLKTKARSQTRQNLCRGECCCFIRGHDVAKSHGEILGDSGTCLGPLDEQKKAIQQHLMNTVEHLESPDFGHFFEAEAFWLLISLACTSSPGFPGKWQDLKWLCCSCFRPTMKFRCLELFWILEPCHLRIYKSFLVTANIYYTTIYM